MRFSVLRQFLVYSNIVKINVGEGFRELVYNFAIRHKYDSAQIKLSLHNPTKTDNLQDRDIRTFETGASVCL